MDMIILEHFNTVGQHYFSAYLIEKVTSTHPQGLSHRMIQSIHGGRDIPHTLLHHNCHHSDRVDHNPQGHLGLKSLGT